MPPVLETPRLKHFRTTREWGCLGHSAPLPPPPVSVSGVADAEDVKVYVLRVPTTPRTGCRATCASQGSREQNTAVCRKVTVVKNELRLGSMVGAYEQKRTAVEELTDQWIAALRRKAVIKRKKVHSAHPAPCSPPPCTAASCSPSLPTPGVVSAWFSLPLSHFPKCICACRDSGLFILRWHV